MKKSHYEKNKEYYKKNREKNKKYFNDYNRKYYYEVIKNIDPNIKMEIQKKEILISFN